MLQTTAFGEQTTVYVKRFVYACMDLYNWTIMNYGGRDAMVIYFGVFGLITLALIRNEMRRKFTARRRLGMSPARLMAIKTVEYGARFVASVSLVLGFVAMAHYQNTI